MSFARDLIDVKEASGYQSYFRSAEYAMKMNRKDLERRYRRRLGCHRASGARAGAIEDQQNFGCNHREIVYLDPQPWAIHNGQTRHPPILL